MLEVIKYNFFTVVLIILAVLMFLCFIRAVRGPMITDRIVAINMIGTLTIIIIAVLTVMMGEGWLADVSLVYAMISFLAVVVLTKIYIGVYRERQEKHNGGEKEETDSEDRK